MAALKLGRKPRLFGPTLHWSSLRHHPSAVGGLFTPPPVNYLDGMSPDFGMLLNDQLGDCVCAACYHGRQVWTYNARGDEATGTDPRVQQLYESACGYAPSDPNTDQGCYVQSVLRHWHGRGIQTIGGLEKLIAWFEIDPRNMADIQSAVFQCGIVCIGFSVPNYIVAGQVPAVWDVQSANAGIAGGHCVAIAGYEADGNLHFVSWGTQYQMTPAFFAKYVDEAYALVDRSWIELTGKTPVGLTLAELEQLAQGL